MALLVLIPRTQTAEQPSPTKASYGGPFTLVDGSGRPFSSEKLEGKPFALYFGFTRCGDICPTTLQRLARLRKEAGSENAMNIVFVTIDPEHDGPKEVSQYQQLFGTPIIGLTGSKAQIDDMKKRYGIFAEPSPHAMAGKEMEHTATVLLFDRGARLAGTITQDETDASALETIKHLAS
jgi:protein SCO1/2